MGTNPRLVWPHERPGKTWGAVCPHCLNVSAGPPLILQNPRRLSPLSQCLSGSSPHPPNPAPFVPIVSMSQWLLPSSSKPRAVCPHCLNVSAGPPLILRTPRRLSPLSQCLSGSSPHPPNPAPFVPIVSMSQWLLPSSSKPRAVCPHCLNVSVVPPLILQTPRRLSPLSQCPSSLLPDSRRGTAGAPNGSSIPDQCP